MRRVKVKSVKNQLADKNVINMFNQMLGTENSDPDIILPKYKLVTSKMKSISKTLNVATNDVLMKMFPEEEDGCKGIIKFILSLDSIDYTVIDDKTEMTDELKRKVCDDYSNLKISNEVKMIIILCKNLIEYSNKFNTDSTFDDSFIARIPGYNFAPFPFSSLNIKFIWNQPQITERTKKYIFTVLRIILDASREIYKTITSPDVDVKEFSSIIINSLSQIKKQIPRCGKAFAKIEQSVSLLENNFSDYYKDFIQSKNPSTIIESFVVDVSRSGGAERETTRQFRTIIRHYQKMTQGKIKDPKVKQIFDMLNNNFNTMDGEIKKNEDNQEIEKAE